MSEYIDSEHFEYQEWCEWWQKARDAIAGTKEIKSPDKAKVYLPELDNHAKYPELYRIYLHRALYFNASARAIQGLSGLIFRKDPEIVIPDSMKESNAQDILAQNLYWVVKEVLKINRCGILVDYERSNEESITVANAEANGNVPYLSQYPAESIINWRELRQNKSGSKLKRVILKDYEYRDDPTDEFKTEVYLTIRVLDLDESGYYRQRIYESGSDREKGGWFLIDEFNPLMNGEKLPFIPFQFFDDIDGTPSVKKPDLLDLYDTNLSHYLTSASIEHIEYWMALDTFIISSDPVVDQNSIFLGPGSVLCIEGGATWGTLSISGEGVTTLKETLAKKEEYMAQQSARMLQPEKRAAEAAETAQIHRMGESSILAQLADAVSMSFENVARWYIDWYGQDSSDIRVKLNTDFMPGILSGQNLTAVVQSYLSGAISFETLFENLQRGEIQREDKTAEDEKEAIEREQGQNVQVFRVPEAQ